MFKPIPYGRQNITDDDIRSVVEVLNSEFLTQGPKIIEFEEAFANYVNSKFAVAVSNGTAALHLSILALDIKSGDKVITSPITFAASANCIRFVGGEVVFADIDPTTYLIDIQSVRKILEASPKGTYKGIIPVDFAGRAVDLQSFYNLAKEYNCWILEDSCHSPGSYFVDNNGNKQLCGNGNFADLSIFSFHPVKHIAAGEGGMITTNNEELYHKLKLLRNHGITKNQSEYLNDVHFANGLPDEKYNFIENEYAPWYMEMLVLGYNYRLSDIQAALGLSQLKRATEGLERRKQIAFRYDESFRDLDFIKGQSGFIDEHSYHLYVIEVDDRFGLYNYLKSSNIHPQIHYIPVHLMPYYRQLGWKVGDMPNAENYYKHCISLPIYPTLTQNEQDYVIEKVISYYQK